MELPAEIGRLTSLQTLPYFNVGEEKGYHIEELGNLKNLKGELTIRNLERVRDKEEALKANILQKQHLSSLQFEWGRDCSGDRNDESVLDGLRPHANLKELKIKGYEGEKFPTWLQDEECEEITLNHFPSLRSFYLWGLRRLECLSTRFFYNHCNLSRLEINRCDMLRALPDGLDTLNSLKVLRIVWCRNLKSIGKPRCREGENRGILRQLSIIDYGELMELPRQMLELWAPTIESIQLVGLRCLANLPMLSYPRLRRLKISGVPHLPLLMDCLAKSSPLLTDLTIRGIPKLMSAGIVESWDLGRLKNLNIDVSVEWSEESSIAINETVNGILEGCCNSLTHLTLRGVENWKWLPQSIQRLTSLTRLKLENIGIEELPQWFGNLSDLRMLCLYDCTKLRCLPSVDALKPLTKLKEIQFPDCPKLSIDSERRNHPNLHIGDTLYIFDDISYGISEVARTGKAALLWESTPSTRLRGFLGFLATKISL
ncbi:putative disease resistance protein RGA4 [Salvia hispanica]|uniref:putative disease resistance protein RGA4 n=1 Tax=Salvia hispanica TaxID=49212 RepID=UPI00200970AE|nr:putative disease resistance protein RGA4 [Salvia hispanica]XP_047956183.1 putative disease resistance protein RGA4 [Salvia hispanica]